MTDNVIAAIVSICSPLGIRSHPVCRTVGSMTVAMRRVRRDSTRSLASADLMLFQLRSVTCSRNRTYFPKGPYPREGSKIYRFRAMQHADAEVPQKESAIVTNTPKSVSSLIALPWIKSYRRNPRVVTLTSCDDLALWQRPYCQ